MAEIGKLKSLVDSYGVAVRAGAITPQIADEKYFRDLMDLPPMSDDAVAFWAATDNVKQPTTLKAEEPDAEPTAPSE